MRPSTSALAFMRRPRPHTHLPTPFRASYTTITTTTAAHAAAAHAAPGLRSLPAWFVRGGTSNGLVLRSADLPSSRSSWPSILAPAMGSPDPVHARQLDGMGSGASSTSKLIVLSPSTTPDAHVAYTFVQVGIRDGTVDVAGNCGNMSSAVGPAAWDMGYVDRRGLVSTEGDGTRWATTRLLNTNTNKIVEARFRVGGGPRMEYCPTGGYEMDGVPGKQSPVTLSFLDPAGAGTGRGALPTGRPVDELRGGEGATVRASLVDVGNPGVFVEGRSLGLEAPPSPAEVEADARLKRSLEALRRQGAAMMGMDPDTESVPKVVMLFPADGQGADLCCRAMSMGLAHRAVPLTLALCLGAAARTEGTLAWEMLRRRAGRGVEGREAVRIAHPSGMVDVDTTVVDGEIKAAKLLRTARVLMKGEVFY
ncbi:DUF453 domain protein [Cordyceps fumosorosea ARSEF 2679]|uniref:DUF453 domain protein n=1 Tax=Cordyceps fumosorosea (strain ARSEF 2679) TaxID=1081104 RepID=A0A167LS42_CORFA|nr:DUF453 domain protein [Cordyceps fumosorosea ARSEF 2679]OAA53433.1 DUF453 domain protein [Cordyceps fumosorosea ARSEF 2679]